MEKQHNRGRSAGFASIKLDVEPGERYNSRVMFQSTHSRCFCSNNDRINEEMAAHPEYADDVAFKSKDPI
jgi:amidophosphoribosyltransferase